MLPNQFVSVIYKTVLCDVLKLGIGKLNKICLNRAMSGIGDDGSRLNLKGMRAKYHDTNNIFTEDDLIDKDPFTQFKSWFEEAAKTPGVIEANAMCLATASKNGIPSARWVLLKDFSNLGFDFFTNYNSHKGKDLEENPNAALTFYWEPLKRSVRIEGRVEKISEEESTDYFHSRPRNSQINSSISEQSKVVCSRDFMEKKVDEFVKKIGSSEIPKPNFWGGYRVIPHSIEFWHGQSSRLHDRIKFRKLADNEVIDATVTHKGKGDWVYERLYP